PSKGLVEKHWHRLPVGQYVLDSVNLRLPIKGITPSNALSYVATFTFHDQRIRVCGDAGCVDFTVRPRGKASSEALLSGVRNPTVVQVAHHAGHNGHFSNVLLAAGIARQPAPTFYLLSHAVEDKSRPSPVFRDYLAALSSRVGDRLLFTSR